jgi:DNA-binding CsgD family transcriptional regulator
VNGLFERGRELEQLDALIERAAGGDGGVVVVEGPAGIGKSRLLGEARTRADGALRVLAARGSQLEGEFAFGVVRQLFEARYATPELLTGAAAPAAAVFGQLDGSEGASFAALHGLYWLVLNLAEQGPLLLAVDDLHWCDRPSLLFFAYLARRLEGQPILLLAGVREAEPGTDPALLGEIAQDPAATHVRPAPLSEAAVATVIEERLGGRPAAAFAAACHEATGGNPLLLSQLATALAGEGVRPDAAFVGRVREIGPRAVSRTVLLRLARLGPDAKAVARAIAVLGDGAALPAVAALAGIEAPRAGAATGELARAEILRAEPPLAFVHPLVRDAVYHELSAGEREVQHAQAADLLRESGAPLEHVAAQLLHTTPRGERWAGELLWDAGRAAMQAGAVDSAVAYLRRAVDDHPFSGQLLFELGAAEVLTSGSAATEHLTRAYETLTDPLARAAVAGLLGRALMFMGSPEAAAVVARRAADELPETLSDLRLALEALEFMTLYFGAPGRDGLSGLRVYRGQPGDGVGARMLAALAAWEMVGSDGTATDCAELALAALAGGRLLAADPALMPFPAVLSLVVADRPEAVEIFRGMVADAHRHGSLLSAGSALLWSGYGELRRGDLAAAEESVRAAADQLERWGHSTAGILLSRTIQAEIMHERGRTEDALALLEWIGSDDPKGNTTFWWLATRATVYTAVGRTAEAVAAADELVVRGRDIPDASRLWRRSLKAEALGRCDEAVALVREELEITRAFGAPAPLGRTLRVLGTLTGDLDALQEATLVLEASTARLEHAKALAAYGSALRRARRPTEAREPLRRALELAGTCGADALAAHARAELHASGARPRRDALSGVESLTPSERRVVDLAAAGRTNRDIAQELYVTPKTVEVHLSNAYRKLGISSRRELERALP